MNSCGYTVGNLGYNPVAILPQFVHRLLDFVAAPKTNHSFSKTRPISSLRFNQTSPHGISLEKQGRNQYLSAFPQPLLLLLLFVYIRKDT
jgi:hypothetical protein